MSDFTPGKVIIAAAGPGDADLLTVKAARYLEQADVILVDRLVNPEILKRYARKDAEVIEVGKQQGKSGSMPQHLINELLVKYALQGKRVLRLKGGDVSVFSNVLDELETLTEKGIRYELVPGVTSALGAAAYAGIPLTARGFSKGVRFLTFLNAEQVGESEWKEWAETTDTLVFYMSGQFLSEMASRLHKAGMSGEKPVAVISQATTPFQHVDIGTIRYFMQADMSANFVSPTLIIVGEVVSHHPRFKWFQEDKTGGEFFTAVSGSRGLINID